MNKNTSVTQDDCPHDWYSVHTFIYKNYKVGDRVVFKHPHAIAKCTVIEVIDTHQVRLAEDDILNFSMAMSTQRIKPMKYAALWAIKTWLTNLVKRNKK